MGFELQLLAFSVILGVLHLVVASGASTAQRGQKWNVSARDQTPPLTGIPARLDRSFKNFKETFVFFAVAIFLVTLSNRSNSLSALGAILYLTARVIYIPLYAFGIPYVRTLVWLVSMVGIALVLVAFFI